ncbi:hypothetical protein J6590_061850 [Homalodisca vitripennis]|nr:hypothetical protein J6590_061850 [Homalodisca vitripennis]
MDIGGHSSIPLLIMEIGMSLEPYVEIISTTDFPSSPRRSATSSVSARVGRKVAGRCSADIPTRRRTDDSQFERSPQTSLIT